MFPSLKFASQNFYGPVPQKLIPQALVPNQVSKPSSDTVMFQGLIFDDSNETKVITESEFGEERGEKKFNGTIDAKNQLTIRGCESLARVKGQAGIGLESTTVRRGVEAFGDISVQDSTTGTIDSSTGSARLENSTVNGEVNADGLAELIQSSATMDVTSRSGNVHLLEAKAGKVSSKTGINAKHCESLGSLFTAGLIDAEDIKVRGDVQAESHTRLVNSTVQGDGILEEGQVISTSGNVEIVGSKISGGVIARAGNVSMIQSDTAGRVESGGAKLTLNDVNIGSAISNGQLEAIKIACQGDIRVKGDSTLNDVDVIGAVASEGSIDAQYSAQIGSLYSENGNVKAFETSVTSTVNAPNGSIEFKSGNAGGALDAYGDIAVQDCEYVGALTSKTGGISVKSADVRGGITAGGTVDLDYCDVDESVNAVNQLKINDCLIKTDAIINGVNATLQLSGDSRVMGQIKFPEGGGKVISDKNSTVEASQIIGGELIKL